MLIDMYVEFCVFNLNEIVSFFLSFLCSFSGLFFSGY